MTSGRGVCVVLRVGKTPRNYYPSYLEVEAGEGHAVLNAHASLWCCFCFKRKAFCVRVCDCVVVRGVRPVPVRPSFTP